MTTDFRWLPFLTFNSTHTFGTDLTGYCSKTVVSTQTRGMSIIQIYVISYIPYLTLALAHVIVCPRTSQHYSSRGPISYRCISAIDHLGHAAHTFHHFLCVDA